MRFCEHTGCDKPVFGTDKLTRIGYCKSHQYLRTDISKESILQRAVKKQRENVAKQTQSKLKALSYESDDNRDMVAAYKSKSELLKEADKVFGDWIKKRDTFHVVDNENQEEYDAVKCPCCKKVFGVDDVDGDGKKIVQPLHFVSRGVYDLRHDADNCFAGDAFCNLKMHLNPKGKEYVIYRRFMVDKFGEEAVVEMERKKRDINKITEQQLRNIIDHYKN